MQDRFRRAEGLHDPFPEEQTARFPWRHLPWLVTAIVVLMLVGTSAMAGDFSQGHFGEGHALYHKQYMKMHNQLGTHCCNEGDCRPTSARWDNATGTWYAKVDGVEREIAPDRHVVDAYGLTEFASVCASPSGHIYCFIPPNSGF